MSQFRTVRFWFFMSLLALSSCTPANKQKLSEMIEEVDTNSPIVGLDPGSSTPAPGIDGEPNDDIPAGEGLPLVEDTEEVMPDSNVAEVPVEASVEAPVEVAVNESDLPEAIPTAEVIANQPVPSVTPEVAAVPAPSETKPLEVATEEPVEIPVSLLAEVKNEQFVYQPEIGVCSNTEGGLGENKGLTQCGSLVSSEILKLDLSSTDLSGLQIVDSKLESVDLSHADLQGAAITGSKLVDVNFNGADVSDIDMTGSSIEASDLSDIEVFEEILSSGAIVEIENKLPAMVIEIEKAIEDSDNEKDEGRNIASLEDDESESSHKKSKEKKDKGKNKDKDKDKEANNDQDNSDRKKIGNSSDKEISHKQAKLTEELIELQKRLDENRKTLTNSKKSVRDLKELHKEGKREVASIKTEVKAISKKQLELLQAKKNNTEELRKFRDQLNASNRDEDKKELREKIRDLKSARNEIVKDIKEMRRERRPVISKVLAANDEAKEILEKAQAQLKDVKKIRKENKKLHDRIFEVLEELKS